MDIFYINRDLDLERNESIVKALKGFPKNVIFSFERIQAIDRTNFPKENWEPTSCVETLTRSNNKAEWYLYIYLSHIKAIQTFYYKSSSNYGAILEDDCDFIWHYINWNRLIKQIEQTHPGWDVIKIYRNFTRTYKEDSTKLYTPYLKARRNCGAVAYLINRSAVKHILAKLDKTKFTFPNFNKFDLTPLLPLFENPVMDTERLLFMSLFEPSQVLQLNIPIIGHTYHFISSKFAPDCSTGFNRSRLLSQDYFSYLTNLKKIPAHVRSINLKLFHLDYHHQLIKSGIATKNSVTNFNHYNNAIKRQEIVSHRGVSQREVNQKGPTHPSNAQSGRASIHREDQEHCCPHQPSIHQKVVETKSSSNKPKPKPKIVQKPNFKPKPKAKAKPKLKPQATTSLTVPVRQRQGIPNNFPLRRQILFYSGPSKQKKEQEYDFGD